MRNRKKIGTQEKEILKAIGIVGFLTLSLAIPNLPMILEPFLKDRKKRAQYKKIIKRLEEKDIIFLSGEKIKLTTKGKKLLGTIEIDDLRIEESDWNGIWKIVAYDIPNKLNKERDYLRKKLIELGFRKVQNSLWAFPYECKEEIAVISHHLRIAPYVVYLRTETLPNEEKFKKSFGL